MIPYEILHSVFRIKCLERIETCFAIERNRMQYFITTKRLFEEIYYARRATIELMIGGEFKGYHVDIRYPSDPRINLAVLKVFPHDVIIPIQNLLFSPDGIKLGQNVFVLSYPHQYEEFLMKFPRINPHLPFVKSACVSAVALHENSIMILDRYMEQGSFGGLVCYQRTEDGMFVIAGVASCGMDERFTTECVNRVFPKEALKPGMYEFMKVYNISFALDIIDNWGRWG